jgi:hypothetical protein
MLRSALLRAWDNARESALGVAVLVALVALFIGIVLLWEPVIVPAADDFTTFVSDVFTPGAGWVHLRYSAGLVAVGCAIYVVLVFLCGFARGLVLDLRKPQG